MSEEIVGYEHKSGLTLFKDLNTYLISHWILFHQLIIQNIH